jgi:hypothetical protein
MFLRSYAPPVAARIVFLSLSADLLDTAQIWESAGDEKRVRRLSRVCAMTSNFRKLKWRMRAMQQRQAHHVFRNRKIFTEEIDNDRTHIGIDTVDDAVRPADNTPSDNTPSDNTCACNDIKGQIIRAIDSKVPSDTQTSLLAAPACIGGRADRLRATHAASVQHRAVAPQDHDEGRRLWPSLHRLSGAAHPRRLQCLEFGDRIDQPIGACDLDIPAAVVEQLLGFLDRSRSVIAAK